MLCVEVYYRTARENYLHVRVPTLSLELGVLVGLAATFVVIAISYLSIPHTILAQVDSCNKYLNLLLTYSFLLLSHLELDKESYNVVARYA